jgi:hypothetical protein
MSTGVGACAREEKVKSNSSVSRADFTGISGNRRSSQEF